MSASRVSVRVPATTANLGPGFDCLGMALDLWNHVTLQIGKSPWVEVFGEGAESLSRSRENLVYRAAALVFQEIGEDAPALALTCRNAVPLSRGLGSSAAAVVGGLTAANLLCRQPLTQARLLELAVALEGHPDNVAPALLGGCQIVVQDDGKLLTSRVELARELRAVLFIPGVTIDTPAARAILPPQVPRKDAVYNLSRTAMLVNALAGGHLELLGMATQDRLHQPARRSLFPAMEPIFKAALAAGALGAFLSGSGPTVLALAQGREVTIGYEMAEAARKAGVEGEFKVVNLTPKGAHQVEAEGD